MHHNSAFWKAMAAEIGKEKTSEQQKADYERALDVLSMCTTQLINGIASDANYAVVEIALQTPEQRERMRQLLDDVIDEFNVEVSKFVRFANTHTFKNARVGQRLLAWVDAQPSKDIKALCAETERLCATMLEDEEIFTLARTAIELSHNVVALVRDAASATPSPTENDDDDAEQQRKLISLIDRVKPKIDVVCERRGAFARAALVARVSLDRTPELTTHLFEAFGAQLEELAKLASPTKRQRELLKRRGIYEAERATVRGARSDLFYCVLIYFILAGLDDAEAIRLAIKKWTPPSE